MFFFFNDTATTEIYTLSLHDALPILRGGETDEGTASAGIEMRCALSHQIRSPQEAIGTGRNFGGFGGEAIVGFARDRKSTRLNSSHSQISYAVFCLKKKKKKD